MKIIKLTTLVVCVAAFCFAQGIAKEPGAGKAITIDKAINDICPIKGKAVKKAVGVKVSFCCKKCLAKFKKKPGDYLVKFAKSEASKCPVSGKDVDVSKKSTVVIGVCCNGCAKKMKAAPKKYIGKVKLKKAKDDSGSKI